MNKTIYTSPEAKRAAEGTARRKNPIECFMEALDRAAAEGKIVYATQPNATTRNGKIFIKARRGRVDQQMEVLKMIESRVNAMQQAESAKEVMAEGGMAAGIANTMLPTGLIDKAELAVMIGMIDKIGSEKLEELAAAGGRRDGNIFSRYLHRRKAETV